MDPVIAEILRASQPVRHDVFRRWQQYLRDSVQPKLDELEALNATAPTPDDKAKKGRVA